MIIILTFLFTILQPKFLQFSQTQIHQQTCYSQGLFFLNSTHLFQSCGLYNQSYFQLLSYSSNPFRLQQVWKSQKPWKNNIFLQGVTLYKNFIYLLTWREHVVFKINSQNFQQIDNFSWEKQGWGLTQNQSHLFISDGSDKIYLTDENFKILDTKEIIDLKGRKLQRINQLQFVQGHIYANIFLDRRIVKINYEQGKVVQQNDGLKLLKNEKSIKYGQVLNGIAFNQNSKKFILTGKNWRYFYQLQL